MFVDVRDPHDGRLLCRYDADRQLLEFQHRKVKTLIDLTQYRTPERPERPTEHASAAERDTNT